MAVNSLSILLIEDNLAEARFLHEVLKGSLFKPFELVHVSRLSGALDQLQQQTFQVGLLDLTLPDSQGLASLQTLTSCAPSLPIVVLTNTNDDELAIEAVRQGAQDYLVKRQVNGEVLVRSLRYAIERKQASEALREANEALEIRVQKRTAQLANINERLTQEIKVHQQTQERLELAQRAGKIGSFAWDIETQQGTWTAELEALYGLSPGAFENRYQNWLKALHPEDRDRIDQEFWSAVEDGRELTSEFRTICPDGSVRWIAIKSDVFCDQDGKPLRMLGIHMNITEKKEMEAQFLQAQRLESLGTLASGIAHDLNNILTPILAITQLLPLKFPNLPDKDQQLLKTLDTSARRGADLVKQILSFARGVEGKRSSLQVSCLLSEICKIIHETFINKSIEIRTHIAKDLWLVSADVTQLHQVLMNLCVNARDAMPDGGTLTLSTMNIEIDEQEARTRLGAKAGAYVKISIEDTGSGIAPDILDRIFDPFFTTKDVGKGTGLGLSAVLGIVKSHEGFVDVQSEPGKGSQFSIYLPAYRGSRTRSPRDLEILAGQQELILVVDDEVAICETMQLTLETHNYRVLVAHDGKEAIALYSQHKDEISGILLDIMMPSQDGMTTLPLLLQLNPHVPIIAMSGIASTETVAQAERLGSRGFLPKPFTAQELLQSLQRIQCRRSG